MSSLEVQRGETINWPITLNQANGDPYDLTGATWAVLGHSLGSNITFNFSITDALTGQSNLNISAEDTERMCVGTKALRIQCTLAGGDAVAVPELPVNIK